MANYNYLNTNFNHRFNYFKFIFMLTYFIIIIVIIDIINNILILFYFFNFLIL